MLKIICPQIIFLSDICTVARLISSVFIVLKDRAANSIAETEHPTDGSAFK
jgi:hypothetical protein